jgi:hypothetical protein
MNFDKNTLAHKGGFRKPRAERIHFSGVTAI